jgi:hypothetical protein
MKEDLDVSEVLDAVERLQRGYRKPLPGADTQLNQSTGSQSNDDRQQSESDSENQIASRPT